MKALVIYIDDEEIAALRKMLWAKKATGNLNPEFDAVDSVAIAVLRAIAVGESVDENPYRVRVDLGVCDGLAVVGGGEIPRGSQRYAEMYEVAKEYYRILDSASQEGIDALKEKLDELIAPFSDNVAYHAFLSMKRMAKGGM